MKPWTGFGFAVAFTIAIGLVSAYGLAQPKPGAPGKAPATGMACDAGTCGGHGKHGDMHCPMTDLAGLVDVKVEKTKTGATLQFTAKDPSKTAEVQAMADKLAEHMKAGGCPMEKSGHGMMMHGHQHGAASPAPAKAAPAASPPAATK